MPTNESEELKRANVRSDKDEPTWTRSEIDTTAPTQAKLLNDNKEPRRT
jgi:hypothetical protein